MQQKKVRIAQIKSKLRKHGSRSGFVFALSFCFLLVISWFLWGKPYLGNSVRLEIADTIQKDDQRIDYHQLNAMVNTINETIILPGTVVFSLESCNDSNAYYELETKRIILCDEMIDDFNSTFSQLYTSQDDIREASTNSLIFIALHEFGHAVIDVLDIPFTGKEEDAADQLSTYLLVTRFPDGAMKVLDGATWFGVVSEEYELEEDDFIGEHSLDAQRYYTLLCWVYGADAEKYGEMIIDGGLSTDRAEMCADEYQALSRNWSILLRDFIK